MNESKLRWGILGTAGIARKNWRAIHNSGNGIIRAVASREADRSRAFIAECQREHPFDPAPRALRSYEALLESADIDAVYIPLPTGLRRDWVLRAAAAGKHVVCEKPCAASVADLRAMIEACESRGVQFLDGVMFMHSRRLEAIREALDDGRSVGELKRIASGFSFCAPPEFFTGNVRAHSALEPFGCLGDLGWYCIRFVLCTLNFRMPWQVSGRLLSQAGRADSPAPVPTEFSAELFFEGGVSASFYCSFITELQQWVHLSGTRGSIRISDFVLPDVGSELGFEISNPSYHVHGCDFRMEPGLRRVTVPEHSHGHPSAQESNLFRNFAAQVRTGQLNRDWPGIALKTQQVMEACVASARLDGRLVSVGNG